jgi:hypothetical protein
MSYRYYHRHCIAIFFTLALTAINAFAFACVFSIPIRNQAGIIHTMKTTAKENDNATTTSIV